MKRLWGCVFVVLVLLFDVSIARAANGFQASSPGARHGTVDASAAANRCRFQRFTAPGSGTITITEIGHWVSADAATTACFRLAIFTDDAVNNNPDVIVTNSETSEYCTTNTSIHKESHAYSPQPTLTGGTIYWLGEYQKDANMNIDRIATGGTAVRVTAATYPTWPTATQWDSGTDVTEDEGVYAVYVTTGGGGFIPSWLPENGGLIE